MADFETLEIVEENHVVHLTINRPKALNALNSQVLSELHSFFEGVSSDTRAVVLRGGGDKAFVAGADISEMTNMSHDEAKDFARKGQMLMRAMESADQVVIACVDGFALGGGCELALACDIIFATEKTKFGQPEVHLGLIPGFGGTQRLMRRINPSVAMDMLLSGRHISGTQAYEHGLVAKCCKDTEEMNAEVQKVLKGVLKGGPRAVSMTKKLARLAWDLSIDEGLKEEASHFGICFENGEGKEGTSAFLEKRSASFNNS